MTAKPITHPSAPHRGGFHPSLGQIAIGLLLVAGGLGWLLDIAGVVTFDWGLVFAGALVLVGGLLIIGARTGGYGGLFGLGIVLTLVLATMSLVNIPFEGGIGERTLRPTTVAAVQSEYSLAIGSQTIDLTQVPFEPGVTEIEAKIGMGQTTIVVPDDVGVQVHWKVGAGNVDIQGFRDNGAGLDRTYTSDNYETATKKLHLELSAGLGAIEVR